MDWHSIRTGIELVTHETFSEPGTFTAPGSDEPRKVVGILKQAVDIEMATNELGYPSLVPMYEIRKNADEGPWAVDDFPEQGRLVLDSGSSYVVTTRIQTDTLITLGLAAEE